MKKLFFLLAVLVPSASFAQIATDPFTIAGHIDNVTTPARAYLLYQLGANKIIDSAEITNGEFKFQGTVINPVNAYLVLDHKGTGIAKVGNSPDLLNFFLEKGVISVMGKDSMALTRIVGSALNDENTDLKQQLKPLEAPTRALYAEINSVPPEKQNDVNFRNMMMAKAKVIQDQQTMILKRFVVNHPDSYLSIFTLNLLGPHSNDPKDLERMFKGLSPALKISEPGRMLEKSIDQSLITGVGAIAPDFTQNDVNGNPVKLSSFRGKYVLVDFWASWCGPCRQESPALVSAYNKFKDKNFTILGVSLDRSTGKSDWLSAIKKDGLNWTQVSDLNFWSNQVAVLYFINSIPANFLLDPNGKIIARDLRGADLENKLAEVLGGKI